MAQVLKHENVRVREEVIRTLGKLGSPFAIKSLSGFIAASKEKEEVALAITTLSLLSEQGVDIALIDCYNKITDYDLKIAVVSAMFRAPTPQTVKFLETVAQRSISEMFTGRNKKLRSAARETLAMIKGKS